MQSSRLAQSIRLRKGLKALLVESKLDEAELLALIKKASVRSERLLSALPRLTEKTLRRLNAVGRLTDESTAKLRESCRTISFERLALTASPLHTLLSDKPIYRDSDESTKRLLREQIERFAKRHALSLEQAASLWDGRQKKERSPALWLLGKCTLWLPILLTLLSGVWLLRVIGKGFVWGALPMVAALFCTIWEGYAHLLETSVRHILPSAAEPALVKEKAPPVCALLTASVKDDAENVLRRLEMLLTANRDAEGIFGLILFLPDAPARYTHEDERLCEPFLKDFQKLEARCKRPLRMAVAERSYLPREHFWRGEPSQEDILIACAALLNGDSAPFWLTVGEKQAHSPPAALYIAPADACLSPDGLRALAATLFHPLTEADFVLPILRTADPTKRDPTDVYTKRQVTLRKLGCSLSFSGYGMIRLTALEDAVKRSAPNALNGTLASISLFTDRSFLPFSAEHPKKTRFFDTLPAFRTACANLLRLPLFLLLMRADPAVLAIGLMLCQADLIAHLFTSVRFGRRFATHTLPAARLTLKRTLRRLIFPVQDCLAALFSVFKHSERSFRPLASFSAVIIGLLSALFGSLPFSVIGLVWALSPLLTSEPIAKRKSALTPSDRTQLLEWNRKSWAIFEQKAMRDFPLPPVRWFERPYLHGSPDTSPSSFAFYLIACLSACDLGFIDAYTLEHKIKASLDEWEKLPTFKGLPYARYSTETVDSCGKIAVSTASCGLFALSMAVLSEGLREYAGQNPALEALAFRAETLWKRMDFTKLCDSDRSAFCEALLPNGEAVGQLDLLMGGAQSAAFAALASGQIDRNAWKLLSRPSAGRGCRRGMQSKFGALEECLLDALFLPASEDSLIGRARRYACRLSTPKKGSLPALYSFAFSDGEDHAITEPPLPSGHDTLALLQTGRSGRRITPHIAFLMHSRSSVFPSSSARTVKFLRAFEAVGALGQYGFYESLDRSEKGEGRIVRMWVTEHLGQSMAASANLLKNGIHARRLMRIPAFASLAPLLNEPYDWLEPSRPTAPYTPVRPDQTNERSSNPPPIYLLGDHAWGLLWANGRRMIPYFHGKAMAYSANPDALTDDGRFSGLLLFRARTPITAPARLFHRDRQMLTLAYSTEGVSLLATLTFPESGLIELKLSSDSIGEPLTVLFCYTPLHTDQAFRLETRPAGNLLLIHAKDCVIALAAEGLEKCFIRADEAPFPLGDHSLVSLLDREGSFTEGSLLTPHCRLGGQLSGQRDGCFRLAFGHSPTEVIQKIRRAQGISPDRVSLPIALNPLPAEEEGTLSYATALQLRLLFEHGAPRPVYLRSASNGRSDNLTRCLRDSLNLPEQRGFNRAEKPCWLDENDSLSADELLKSYLHPKRQSMLTSPPLPARTRIKLTEQTLTLRKGRDLPAVCRVYASGPCAFYADSFTPSFAFDSSELPISLTLTLPGSDGSERSLFFGAGEVSYSAEGVCYTGEGYCVSVTLSAERRLLIIEVRAPHPAHLRLGLPTPSGHSEDSDFWHRKGRTVDFCSTVACEGKTIFLLGSFERSCDRRYYRIREEIGNLLRRHLPFAEAEPLSAELIWQSKPPYPTPLLVHPALASEPPAAFPLLLFFREQSALRALERLFSTDDRAMQVIACLLWEASTEDRDALRQKLIRPTDSGDGKVKESIYLSAARALESMLEENTSILLPYLTASFADLAHRMGDLSGEAYYRGLPHAPIRLPEHPHSFEAIAAYLLAGDPRGTAAWKKRMDARGLFPSPEEASALWSLFWYGVLGYRESPIGFSLMPLLCDAFEGCAFHLRRRDTLYRIRISFSDRSICLLDGRACNPPFLFDKKAHFLEITVEKSAQMV